MGQNSIYNDILRNYEALRDKAARERLLRQEEIYAKIPRIREIDDEISSVGFQMAKSVMNKEKSAKSAADEAREKIGALKKEKEDILVKYGWGADFLEEKFNCPKCSDTGYVDGKKCGCFSGMLVNALYGRSGLDSAMKDVSLKDFKLGLYSDKPYGNFSKTPLENMKSNLSIVEDFIANFGKEYKNLMFFGETGLGKTFLCTCIAKELLDDGYFVIYITAPKLFKLIEEERFSRNNDEEPARFLDDIMEADLLIIDDLGSEFATILSASEIFNIINSRLIDKKPIIISTNLPPSDWSSHYSDRFTSRIVGNYEILNFYGEDIRWKMKKNL